MPTVGRRAKRTSGDCRGKGRRRALPSRGVGEKERQQGAVTVVDGPRDKWKPDLKVVKATIHILEQTGRLTCRPQAVEA